MMRTRIFVLTMMAGSVAMAGPFRKAEKQVSFETRPKGSEWLGEWKPELTQEEQVRRWAEAARHRLGVIEAATSTTKPRDDGPARASAVPASSSSSR